MKLYKHFFGKISGFLVLALLSSGNIIFSQQTEKKTYPAAENFTVYKAEGSIKIDGSLTEKDWEKAQIIRLPFEWTPGDNIPAPVETQCLMTFSSSHVYIGFRCLDPEPSKIRAHLMDRDAVDTLIQDDHISIMIDSFNDERRGFQFRVNPLGVQADAIFSEMEGYEDFSWDAIWESAGQITDKGYSIEIAIPFNQLRFPKSNQEQTWGFTAERSYPRNVRHRMTSHVRARDRNCILCQFNKLSGFKGMSPGKNFEFDPTLTINRTDKRDDFPAGKLNEGKIKVKPGITARWGVTSNVILNATVNPDFSQVEADVAQLEVNTRFTLRYPEKRPFFLEGADFFLTPFEAVFSRTIYDPIWGAKVTSKFNQNALGVFATQDRYNNLLFPSNQGSDTYSVKEDVFSGVLRYRRDIGRGSAIGLLYTGRSGDEYSNHLAGIDGFFRLSGSKTINFQYLFSRTKYNPGVGEVYGQPANFFNGGALYADFSHMGRNIIYGLTYEDKSPQFRADLGFIPRVDTREFGGRFIPIVWGKQGGWFTQLNFPIVASYTVDYKGKMTDQMILFQTAYQGPMQINMNFSVYFNREFYNDKTYNKNYCQGYFAIKPMGGIHFNIYSQYGDAIDYVNSLPAKSFLLMPALEWGIGRHLNLNISHVYENLFKSVENIYKANLFQAKLIYNFNVRTFIRAIVQYTLIDRNTGAYLFDIAPKYKGLFTQILFSYKINPQTVLFLGYSDNSLGAKSLDLTRLNRTFFLKIGYALVY